MGGSQGESSGDSRGSSLTNGDLSEEQIPGPVARRQSSKSHGSAGRKVCSPRHGVTHSLRTQAFYIYVVTLLRKLLKGSIQENNHVTPRYSEW